jgi:hypothetical protein
MPLPVRYWVQAGLALRRRTLKLPVMDGPRLTSWPEKFVIMGVLANRSYGVPFCARKALGKASDFRT